MKKFKCLLTGLLCLAVSISSIQVGAFTINRHGPESEDTSDMEESSTLDTKEEEVEKEKEVDVTHTETVDTVEPADIVFLIDSTGSMAPYIQNVADNVKAFSEYLESKKVDGKAIDVRMGVVEYKDITCDGKNSTIVHTIDGSPWHKTTSQLVETLGIVKSGVDGGGDEPETLFDAFGYITDETSFDFGRAGEKDNTHKFAIVLTDANYKTENTFDLTKETLISKLKKQDINPSVITSKRHFSAYSDFIGSEGITTDINSKTFSDDLIKLADVIFKTIEKEVHETDIIIEKSIVVTCTGKNTIKVGNSATLNAIIKPETAENKKVTWVVEDESIAGLDISSDTMTCTVTGKKAGTTKVTAISENEGFMGNYTITVFDGSSDIPVLAIELEKEDISVTPAKKTIARKKSFIIKAEFSKGFKADKEAEELDDIWESNVDSITYRSTKSSIASVNKDGKVTGKKKGKAIIKTNVILADGTDFKYKITVYVK